MATVSAIHVSSEHPKELGAFYQQVLQIEPESQSDDGYSFLLGEIRILILFHDQVHGKNTMPGRLMFTLGVDDVASEFKRIVALGARKSWARSKIIFPRKPSRRRPTFTS